MFKAFSWVINFQKSALWLSFHLEYSGCGQILSKGLALSPWPHGCLLQGCTIHLIFFKTSPAQHIVNLKQACVFSRHNTFSQAKLKLIWWISSPDLKIEKPFLPHHWKVIKDISLSGWGGVFQFLMVQGTWSIVEAKIHINIVARRAIKMTLQNGTSAGTPIQGAIRQCCGLHQPLKGHQP